MIHNDVGGRKRPERPMEDTLLYHLALHETSSIASIPWYAYLFFLQPFSARISCTSLEYLFDHLGTPSVSCLELFLDSRTDAVTVLAAIILAMVCYQRCYSMRVAGSLHRLLCVQVATWSTMSKCRTPALCVCRTRLPHAVASSSLENG